MAWTEEKTEELKKLWAEGHTASQISKMLGSGISRNAVIGKSHRLNLQGRAQSRMGIASKNIIYTCARRIIRQSNLLRQAQMSKHNHHRTLLLVAQYIDVVRQVFFGLRVDNSSAVIRALTQWH